MDLTVQTWSTVLAAAAAVLAVVAGRVDARREKRRDDDRLREHAVRFVARAASDRRTKPVYGILVENLSWAPFHDITMQALVHDLPTPVLKIDRLSPGRFWIQFVLPEKGGVSSGAWGFPIGEGELAHPIRELTTTQRYKVEWAQFRDVNGRRWKVDGAGALTREPERLADLSGFLRRSRPA